MSGENNAKKLSFKTKIGYAIGQMTDSTGYNVYYFFFLYFLTDFAGIPAGIAGTISLIAIMWDAVTDPIVGNISDNLKSPYGRRRPLMIGATIPYAICVFLLFNNVSFGTNVKFAYFVVLAILFWSCYKTYVIPFFALGAELTDDFNERTTLRSWASVFLQLAVMLASAAPPMILEMAGKAGLQGARGWNAVGVSFGLIILISSFICWACTRGGEIIDRNQEEKKQVKAQEKANLFKNFLQILKLKPALLLAISVFLWNITTVFMSSGAVYALTGLLRASAGQQSTAFVVQCVMGIVWLPLINMLANRIDKKFIYWAGMGISAVIMLCFTFIGFGSFPIWLVYVSIFAFGNSVFWTVYYSMMYDISELDEFKTGNRREGIISALMSFFQKLGAALATWVMGLLLSTGGYDGSAAVQSESALNMIHYIVTAIPAVIGILAALLALAYPITAKRFDALMAALKAKREGKPYTTDGFEKLL
ncbi:MAG: MFS transporter [Firmicutes bacterium]|jgi:GPH family glycoside/pentoside/hexuronide:cation symporter|nr:MFS transporter [Bacillota bacterium]